jgi:excisionase family DNA binding protein
MDNKYLNADNTSKLLNISKSTIYAYVGKKKIPFIKLGGKLLFSENDITKWLETKKQITSEGQ